MTQGKQWKKTLCFKKETNGNLKILLIGICIPLAGGASTFLGTGVGASGTAFLTTLGTWKIFYGHFEKLHATNRTTPMSPNPPQNIDIF